MAAAVRLSVPHRDRPAAALIVTGEFGARVAEFLRQLVPEVAAYGARPG
jgi:hypothetical protein